MECEAIYPLESSFIDEINVETLDPSYVFQNGFPISRCTIQDDIPSSTDVDVHRLLQIETDLMDFDFIVHDSVSGLQNAECDPIPPNTFQQMNEQVHQNVDVCSGKSKVQGLEEEQVEARALTSLLISGAEAVEGKNWSGASAITARLNDLLLNQRNRDEPSNRLAVFFAEGLHWKSSKASHVLQTPVSQKSSNISAFQMVQELAPYVKFGHFTANQAILEATEGESSVHIVDFDIIDGVQWPPLMIDLAARKDASLRITAIVVDNQSSDTIQQTGRRLKDFADSINLPFVFDHLLMEGEEDFNKIEVGNILIANCMTHQLHMPHRDFSMIKTFLGGISKLSPKIIVTVEEELFMVAKIPFMSFAEFISEAIHHYTALLDSLTSGFNGGYKLALGVIEEEFLRIRILESVRKFPCEVRERQIWKDGYAFLKGFRPIPLSPSNVSQARSLISLFNGGYWVQHEQCKLSLSWRSKPLTSVSVWVPYGSIL